MKTAQMFRLLKYVAHAEREFKEPRFVPKIAQSESARSDPLLFTLLNFCFLENCRKETEEWVSVRLAPFQVILLIWTRAATSLGKEHNDPPLHCVWALAAWQNGTNASFIQKLCHVCSVSSGWMKNTVRRLNKSTDTLIKHYSSKSVK